MEALLEKPDRCPAQSSQHRQRPRRQRPDPPFIAMEFVPGVSLREHDAGARGLPVEVALTIAIDVLRGLATRTEVTRASASPSRHQAPQHDGHVRRGHQADRLRDLALAQPTAGWESTSVSGTLGYMAPEQQPAARRRTRRPVCGRRHAARDAHRDLAAQRDQPPAPTAALDPALAAIVERAMQERPEDRYPDCNAVLAAIEDYASTRGIALSPTQVERWLEPQFAERSLAIERDAEVVSGGRRRPPTMPTILDGGRASADEPLRVLRAASRVAFVLRNLGGPDDAWLAPVIERLMRRHFRHAEDRRFFVVSGNDRDIALRIALAYLRRDDGIQIDAVHAGAAIVLGSAAAPSVAIAVNEIALQLTRELGRDLPAVGPTEHEVAVMKRLGASSFDCFRGYRAILESYLTTNWVDGPALLARTEELFVADPAWAHLYALRAILNGMVTPSAAEMLEIGRDRSDRARDPSGVKLIEAIACAARRERSRIRSPRRDLSGQRTRPARRHQAHSRHGPGATTDETMAVARQLHEHYPELLFSAGTGGGLAKAADPPTPRRWSARGPLRRLTTWWLRSS